MDPKSNRIGILSRSGKETQTQRESSPVQAEAKIDILLTQSKECLGLPEARRSKVGHFPKSVHREHGSIQQVDFGFSLSRIIREQIYCFNEPSKCNNLLWYPGKEIY